MHHAAQSARGLLFLALLAPPLTSSLQAQCQDDIDCSATGKICVGGECVRPGLRSPVDDYGLPNHRYQRRDDEIFWVSQLGVPAPPTSGGPLAGANPVALPLAGFVMTPEETFLSPDLLPAQPLAGASGRVLGRGQEQAVLVTRAGSNGAAGTHVLRVHDLLNMDPSGRVNFGSPVVGEYYFTPSPNNPHIGVAVADLDIAAEVGIQEEFHDEVALVYQDAQSNRPRLVVMSFEDSGEGGSLEPRHVVSDVPVLDLPTGVDPSHLSIAMGEFLPAETFGDVRREIAVGGYDSVQGEVVIWVYQIVVQPDGSRALQLAETPDGGSGSLAAISTNQPNRAFGIMGGRFDDLDGVPNAWNTEQIMLANLGVGNGFIKARAFTVYQGASGWSWDAPPASRYNATSVGTHGPSGDDVEPRANSRLILSKGRFPGATGSGGWGAEQACLFYDTNYGPVMQIIGFSTQTGAPSTGPVYSNPLVWPTQAVLDARTKINSNTRSYGIGGNFLHYRAEIVSPSGNRGRSRIYVSYPDEGVPHSYGYVAGTGGFVGGALEVVLDENGAPITEPMQLMLGVDVDGDTAYQRFDQGDGTFVYTGLGTRYTTGSIQSLITELQEPPKHLDYLPPGLNLPYQGMLNVSQQNEFNVSFFTQSSAAETFDKEIQTDYRFSDAQSLKVSGEVTVGVEGNSGTVSASNESTMKSVHDNNTGYFVSETTSVTLTSLLKTEQDDLLTLESQTLDVWRFPAIGVVQVDDEDDPLPLDQQPTHPTYEITFPGVPTVDVSSGKALDAYQPTHINGNIMGYPSYDVTAFTPGDLGPFVELEDSNGDGIPDGTSSTQPPPGEPLWANQTYTIGSVSTFERLRYESTDMDSTHAGTTDTYKSSETFKVGGSVEVSGAYASSSASVQQSYSSKSSHSVAKAKTSSNTNSLTTEVGLDIVPSLETDFAYGIAPIWYFTAAGGVKVAHAVSTTQGASGFVWNATYSSPDPALNLPNRFSFDQGTGAWELNTGLTRQRTKGVVVRDAKGDELYLTPAEGEVLKIAARVYNLSTVTVASNVRVRFLAQESRDGRERSQRGGPPHSDW